MTKKTIRLSECQTRRLYRVSSRNLTYGVYDGDTGFVGIRTKFGNRFLAREYHWDTGRPFGTVLPREDTGIDVPESIPVGAWMELSEELFQWMDEFERAQESD